MSRRRWRITVLAALATLSALYPITSLFTDSTWLPAAVLVVALVAGLGLVGRGLTRSRLLVVLAQVLVTGYVLLAVWAGNTFAFLLPTPATAEAANTLGLQALETVQRYSAPAPLNDGITFCLLVAVALVAIAVDAVAATWRSPAAAGLPLLTAYLITAANGDSALALRFFVVPVALWLAMLHTTARAQFGRWGTTRAAGGGSIEEAAHDREALRSFSAGALRLGAVGVVAAVLVPAVVPHFPPHYLTEGLGHSSNGAGGEGSVGFNDTLDLSRSLNDQDQTPVLTYTTTGFSRPPLRVLATSYYSRGQWTAVGSAAEQADSPAPLPPPNQRRDFVLSVTNNTLAAPRIAAPYPVVAVAMEGTPWAIDPVTRDVRVGRSVSSYRITYADLAPTPPQLRESGKPDSPAITGDDLAVPDRSRELVQRWSDEVTRGSANPLDKAIAIQNHLRDTSVYTYSLDLGEPLRDSEGRLLDPIQSFYQTRRGYCVQFATAMIMMARAQGIPARMAIGFLPGQLSGEEYVVRASDAHAWPELYFQGYGWLRFEPTPGVRSGSPPPYAVLGSDSGATRGGREVTESRSGGAVASAPTKATKPTVAPVAQQPSFLDSVGQAFSLRNVAVFVAILLGLLAAFSMPITAWLLRLRRRRAAVSQQDLIEAEWAELTSHLGDLGIAAPPGGTLRQVRERYVTDAHLDDENASAMRRVTATLEKSRYDRPERTTAQEAVRLHQDIRAIRRQVGRTRAWQVRVRSFLWPQAGVSYWRALPSRVSARVPSSISRRLPRRSTRPR
ncbi:transglutaminaseTgpA domain-containing protein [Terrabacter sp. BE26]|uniref:transglutaminase family protein n=1 Tax=Terrabacter sp. BE26 TaxID=2898152 RepID=UPI0035BE513D